MQKILSIISDKNIKTGFLYFYIHFVVEVVCFYVLSNVIGDSIVLWLVPFVYDAFAFVPQAIIGYLADIKPKVDIGLIGVFFLTLGILIFGLNIFNIYLTIIIICIGNACLHVAGAEVTLCCSNGRLSPAAVFVSGGSFGLVTGKLLAMVKVPYIIIAMFSLSTIPFVILGSIYRKQALKNEKYPCKKYNYHNKDINIGLLILLTVLIVIVRGFMGYGVPTTWNKSVMQMIMLYVAMGIGKALGGILSDAFGAFKISILSILCALPFLLFGDNIMYISLIGIMLFSMTMPITLGILVSALPKSPGLAFGLTTIGLFLGTVPIFFIRFTTLISQITIISILTIICLLVVLKVLKRDEKT